MLSEGCFVGLYSIIRQQGGQNQDKSYNSDNSDILPISVRFVKLAGGSCGTWRDLEGRGGTWKDAFGPSGAGMVTYVLNVTTRLLQVCVIHPPHQYSPIQGFPWSFATQGVTHRRLQGGDRKPANTAKTAKTLNILN